MYEFGIGVAQDKTQAAAWYAEAAARGHVYAKMDLEAMSQDGGGGAPGGVPGL